jgi:hypothetical protein
VGAVGAGLGVGPIGPHEPDGRGERLMDTLDRGEAVRLNDVKGTDD